MLNLQFCQLWFRPTDCHITQRNDHSRKYEFILIDPKPKWSGRCEQYVPCWPLSLSLYRLYGHWLVKPVSGERQQPGHRSLFKVSAIAERFSCRYNVLTESWRSCIVLWVELSWVELWWKRRCKRMKGKLLDSSQIFFFFFPSHRFVSEFSLLVNHNPRSQIIPACQAVAADKKQGT